MNRPFYIIHHNPNCIGNNEDEKSAVYALSHGANALGPDVIFTKNNFWVMHHVNPATTTNDAPLLKDYLAELAEILQNNSAYNLQLIAFDLKDTEERPYDFADMQKIIADNFSSRIRNVGMIFSTPRNIDFLLNNVAPNLMPNQAAGTDEYDDPGHADESFRGKGFPYVFGCGNSTLFHSIYKPISKAVTMRDSGKSFRFVFPWTIDTKSSYRRYLDLGVDAMITNKPDHLRNLIAKEYSHRYELNGKFPGFEFPL